MKKQQLKQSIWGVWALSILVLLSACSSNNAVEGKQSKRVKAENIESVGKHGSVKEERVKAVGSDLRYVPNGQEGYRLVDPALEDAKENAHRNPENLIIPSWTLGTW